MSLEDLTGATKYLNALNPANPDPLDAKSQGDDHIRGIKNVLLNTFGAISAPIDMSRATFDNTVEVITAGWSFTGKALFLNAEFTPYLGEGGQAAWQNAAGIPAFFVDVTGSGGTEVFRIFDRLGATVITYGLADGFMRTINKASEPQRMGWHPGTKAGGTRTLTLGDIGNSIYNDGAGTLTLDNLGQNGETIEVVNTSSGIYVIAAGTQTLVWMKGGSQSVGNRSIAPSSVATLKKFAPNVWMIWGNGIS